MAYDDNSEWVSGVFRNIGLEFGVPSTVSTSAIRISWIHLRSTSLPGEVQFRSADDSTLYYTLWCSDTTGAFNAQEKLIRMRHELPDLLIKLRLVGGPIETEIHYWTPGP